VLEKHLWSVRKEDEQIAELLLEGMFVDNCVISLDSVEESKEFRKTSTNLMAEAKMELRHWEFSVEEEIRIDLTKILGADWSPAMGVISWKLPLFWA
jgi:outer membrane receptor for ferrienterochelin and colicin